MREALDAAREAAGTAAAQARAEAEAEMAIRVKDIEAEYQARQKVSPEITRKKLVCQSCAEYSHATNSPTRSHCFIVSEME